MRCECGAEDEWSSRRDRDTLDVAGALLRSLLSIHAMLCRQLAARFQHLERFSHTDYQDAVFRVPKASIAHMQEPRCVRADRVV